MLQPVQMHHISAGWDDCVRQQRYVHFVIRAGIIRGVLENVCRPSIHAAVRKDLVIQAFVRDWWQWRLVLRIHRWPSLSKNFGSAREVRKMTCLNRIRPPLVSLLLGSRMTLSNGNRYTTTISVGGQHSDSATICRSCTNLWESGRRPPAVISGLGCEEVIVAMEDINHRVFRVEGDF